jgi:transposase
MLVVFCKAHFGGLFCCPAKSLTHRRKAVFYILEPDMAGGRPTDYKPEYCDRVIEFGRLGKSITWMAAELKVSRSTINLWAQVHEEFSDALSTAQALSQQWWEDAGQNALASKEFNSSVWAKSMAARFPEDWRDNSKVELGGGVQHEHTIRVVLDED